MYTPAILTVKPTEQSAQWKAHLWTPTSGEFSAMGFSPVDAMRELERNQEPFFSIFKARVTEVIRRHNLGFGKIKLMHLMGGVNLCTIVAR